MPTTLADIATIAEDRIRRSDLLTQIKREIGEAVRILNRKPYAFTEIRLGEFATVAAQGRYATVDFSGGESENAELAGLSAVAVGDILGIDYMNVLEDGQVWEVRPITYREYERLREGVSLSTTPTNYARYAGGLYLWPTPGEIYTVYVSARVKPGVPSGDAAESVWFEKAPDLVASMAAARALALYAHDDAGAARQMGDFTEIEAGLFQEQARQRGTGFIKPTRF